MRRALHVFARVWSSAVMALVLVGAVGLLITRGWPAFSEVFSPWNLKNWGLILVLLAPAVLAERLSK